MSNIHRFATIYPLTNKSITNMHSIVNEPVIQTTEKQWVLNGQKINVIWNLVQFFNIITHDNTFIYPLHPNSKPIWNQHYWQYITTNATTNVNIIWPFQYHNLISESFCMVICVWEFNHYMFYIFTCTNVREHALVTVSLLLQHRKAPIRNWIYIIKC